MLPTRGAGENLHHSASHVSVLADIRGGDVVAEERPSGLHDALSVRKYPGPQARASNQLHEIDRVGPVSLKGRGRRYYIGVGKDVFEGAVCLRLAYSRRMDEVLGFLGECWKDLGRGCDRRLM
jgi:hypothetical protein